MASSLLDAPLSDSDLEDAMETNSKYEKIKKDVRFRFQPQLPQWPLWLRMSRLQKHSLFIFTYWVMCCLHAFYMVGRTFKPHDPACSFACQTQPPFMIIMASYGIIISCLLWPLFDIVVIFIYYASSPFCFLINQSSCVPPSGTLVEFFFSL